MPPKRKRKAASSGGDDGIVTPTPKKSKKEALAEARARAKAWHDQKVARAAGGGGGGATSASAAKKIPSAPATTGKLLSTRTKTTVATSPPKKVSATSKRRRTPSRKSTGGAVDSSLTAKTTLAAEKIKKEPARKVRRASSGTAVATASGTTFEFNPPMEEEEDEEDSSDDPEMKEAAVQSTGPPSKTPSRKKSPPEKYEFGSQESDDEKQMNDKKRKEEGRERIRALREKREHKGLPVSHSRHRAAVASTTTPHRDRVPSPKAEERKSPPRRRRSLDPPAADTAPETTLVTASNAVAASETSLTTATKTFEFGSPDPPPASKKRPPPSVASIFAAPKSRSANDVHRPYKQKFDPNQPFPTSGYRLPTAAYCGCGPTPGSTTTSMRGATAAAEEGSADHCVVDPATRNGSFTTSADMKENMGLISPVDPPYQRNLSGGNEDERKMPARPSPPGRNESGEVMEVESSGNEGGEVNVPVPAAAAGNVPIPTAAAPATPVATTGFLTAAISRANALVTSAAGSNQKRRAMMGIHSAMNNGNTQTVQAEGQTEKVGLPPRDVIQTESQMDTVLEELDNVKSPVDPPMIDSAPISYANTLQRFRQAGGATTNPPEIKEENKPDDNATAVTVAGEHTSEIRADEEEISVNANEDRELERKPSSLKRGCFLLMKIIMFLQIAYGIIYLVTNHSSFYTWIGDSTTAPEKVSEFSTEKPNGDMPCFYNYPDEKLSYVDDYYGCEGEYKKCPPWGRCHAGKLVDCTDGEGVFNGMRRFVPNERGDDCVPSPNATEIVELVRQVLVGMTIAENCGSSERIQEPEAMSNLNNDYPFPLYSLEKVAEKIQEQFTEGIAKHVCPDLLIWLHPAVDSKLVKFGLLPGGDDEDDVIAVGLGTDIAPGSLPIPFDCTTRLIIWELLEYLGKFALFLMAFSFQRFWFLVTNYPLYVIGAIAMWKLFAVVQRKRKHRAKVRELFGTVLEAVYDRLSECENDNQGYAALILRDDVGHDMYPTSFRERKFMFDYVWPRVTLEIRADNRVRKFHKVMTGGKDLEHWDFAIQSKRGRRLRKSTGGSSDTTCVGEAKGDAKSQPVKREP